jgi:hypothetical protein
MLRSATTHRILIFACALALGIPATFAQQASAPKPPSRTPDMTVVAPESVGFSSERLKNLHAFMQKAVDDKTVPGIVTILARHGKVVDYRTYGQRDVASATPMT